MKILTDKKLQQLKDEITKQVTAELEQKYAKLDEERQANVKSVEDGMSCTRFLFDNDLKVTVKSDIQKDIVKALVDAEYISSTSSEDEHAIQIAFIMMANEVTEQIISELDIGE